MSRFFWKFLALFCGCLGLPRLAADRVNLGSGVNWGEGLTPRRFLTQWHFIHGA